MTRFPLAAIVLLLLVCIVDGRQPQPAPTPEARAEAGLICGMRDPATGVTIFPAAGVADIVPALQRLWGDEKYGARAFARLTSIRREVISSGRPIVRLATSPSRASQRT